jgi:hypothetical protein
MLSGALIDASAGLESAWLEITDFLADAWRVVCDGIKGTWDSTVGFVQKLWVRLRSLLGEEVNVEAEAGKIDQANASAAAAREAARDKEIGDRDTARQKKRQQIEADRLGAKDALAADAERAQEQIRAGTEQAQADLAAAKAEAKAKREGLPPPTETKKTAPGLEDLAVEEKFKEVKGISSADLRSSEGTKSLFASLRQAQDADPQKKSAKFLESLDRTQSRSFNELQKQTKALEGQKTRSI